MKELWIILGTIGAIIVFLVVLLISLLGMKKKAEQSWPALDGLWQKRLEAITALAKAVTEYLDYKGYVKREKEILQNLDAALTEAQNTLGLSPYYKAMAEIKIAEHFKKLLLDIEKLPELKSRKEFMAVQKQFNDVDGEYCAAQQNYNTLAGTYNSRVLMFPFNMVASMFSCDSVETFDTELPPPAA